MAYVIAEVLADTREMVRELARLFPLVGDLGKPRAAIVVAPVEATDHCVGYVDVLCSAHC